MQIVESTTLKTESKPNKNQINDFWSWFRRNAATLTSETSTAAEQLDTRVRGLHPDISWEIGPGLTKSWQLAISPNLNRDLRDVTRSIVKESPSLDEWEFYSARQPKAWNYSFKLDRENGEENIAIDAANWTFVLLRYPDGLREVLLKAHALPRLTKGERWQIGAIVLEGILGEDNFLDVVDEFEVVDELEPRFAEKERPIQDLRTAAMGK